MPIEIVFDMLGFNMLNPKMKNHPPFVLPRLSNMQRSQRWEETKTAFEIFLLAWVTQTNLISKYSPSTTLYYKVLVQCYSVLQSTSPVLLCTTKYYSSTTLYYTVLLQYYSVLQSTTPVLLCTTKYYSVQHSTTLYYTILLQYYSVLQSTTPVPLCTTKYYSGTRKYCSSTTPVLQSTTPVLICTTKYLHTWHVIYNARSNKSQPPTSATTAPATQNDSRDQSATHPKRYFTMRGTTGGILQHHQILRLPRKMTVMTDPRHIWNVIYNAQNNRWHPPTSPNTAPATQIDAWNFHQNFSKTAETSFPMRGRSENDPSRIREWSENDPSNIRATSEQETVRRNPASQQRLLFAPITSILYWKLQHFALRLSFQISPNTAPATKNDSSTSPNTAPPTQNESHDWSLSHMKRYLQCAEQPVSSSSNITEYCACHAKWLS